MNDRHSEPPPARSPAPQPACPLRDEVVALFLDGDAGLRSGVECEELAAHRDACDDCRQTLDRARRIDALVAGEAGAAAAAVDLEAWLDGALEAALEGGRGRPHPEQGGGAAFRARRRAVALAGAVALVFGLGLALGRGLAGGPEASAGAPQPVAPDPAGPIVDGGARSAVADGLILLPDGPVRSIGRRDRGRPDPAALAALAAAGRLEFAVLPGVLLRDGAANGWSRVTRDAERLRAAAVAALGASDEGLRQLAELIADLPDDRRLAVCAAAVRASAPAAGLLEEGLRADSARALRVAARVGGPRLDRALAAWVGGDAGRGFRLADELRTIRSRAGRAGLLLGVWRGIEARGGADRDACAERLFRGLGGADAAVICGLLAGSRHAAERERCLLALAALHGPDLADALWPVLVGPRRDEALLAAFALGRVPRAADDLAGRRPPASARALWLAALAARGEARARQEIAALSVSADERAFLCEGGFTVQQIEIAARLFRDRGGRAD
jgi:rhodanese-related sulfurtransferase